MVPAQEDVGLQQAWVQSQRRLRAGLSSACTLCEELRVECQLPWPNHSTQDMDSIRTSFALCCIRISLSISCTCCSSLNASAHGTPRNSALVLTTHSVLPPKVNAFVAHEYPVDDTLEMLLRYVGGTMSLRAATRSKRDSSSASSSSTSEISESGD